MKNPTLPHIKTRGIVAFKIGQTFFLCILMFRFVSDKNMQEAIAYKEQALINLEHKLRRFPKLIPFSELALPR